MRKKDKIQVNWLQVLIIFILGLLIATNVFLALELNEKNNQISKISNEIEKLKADDIAIAQVINNLITQLQTNRVIAPPLNNPEN
jgi:cell division protein FtsB